mgnify:CR=1 FL=1
MKSLNLSYTENTGVGTVVHVAVDGKYAGYILISDVIKDGAKEAIASLKNSGVKKCVMLTGDSKTVAEYVAGELKLDEVHSELLPADKVSCVEKLLQDKSEKEKLAFVGDGINDAPVLSRADIGIAMNSGTQAAKEAGNMVDLDSDPTKLIEVIEIGKQLLMTRGALTTFSIANDVAKYFAIIPAIFMLAIPELAVLNINARPYGGRTPSTAAAVPLPRRGRSWGFAGQSLRPCRRLDIGALRSPL